jgi:hypothetical protein
VLTLRTHIDIDASADDVWEVLTDFRAYPEWNPFIRRIEGEPVAGARLRVHIQPEGGTGFRARPRVLRVEPGREFSWLGHLGIPGVFDGEHRFRIESMEEGVRFIQEEEFRGVLLPLLRNKLETETRRGFEDMNRALRRRLERRDVVGDGG